MRDSPGTMNSRGISTCASRSQERVDPLDHLRRDSRRAVLQAIPGVRVGGQLRTDDEQLALEPQDEVGDPGQARRHHVELLLEPELGAGEPEGGHGLVDRAVGLGAWSSLAIRSPP